MSANPRPNLRDGRHKNWFWLDNAVVDECAEQIGADALALYTILCRLVDDESGKAFPPNDYLQKKMGRSAPTIRKAYTVLKEHGLIQIVPRFRDDGGRLPNDIYLLDPRKQGSLPPETDLRGVGNQFSSTNTQNTNTHDKNNSRRGADAPTQPEKKNWVDYYFKSLDFHQILITPEDRKYTVKHLKDLLRLQDPTDEDMHKVIVGLMQARQRGYDDSPQKVYQRLQGNVTQLRPGQGPLQPEKRRAELPTYDELTSRRANR
jgi:hypothetical protein